MYVIHLTIDYYELKRYSSYTYLISVNNPLYSNTLLIQIEENQRGFDTADFSSEWKVLLVRDL